MKDLGLVIFAKCKSETRPQVRSHRFSFTAEPCLINTQDTNGRRSDIIDIGFQLA